MASNNRLLSSRTQRYEVKASNGQVIVHSLTSQKAAAQWIKEFKTRYPEEHFTICGYDRGKYGNE